MGAMEGTEQEGSIPTWMEVPFSQLFFKINNFTNIYWEIFIETIHIWIGKNYYEKILKNKSFNHPDLEMNVTLDPLEVLLRSMSNCK